MPKSKRKKIQEDGFLKGKPVNVRGFTGKSREADEFGVPPEPLLPPRLGDTPTREFLLSTIGGVHRFTATNIGQVVQSSPQIIETEVVGRVAGTSMGDRSRMTATIDCALLGRIRGEDVTERWRSLLLSVRAGHVVRVYGPLDAPGIQGVTWSLAPPTPTETGFLPGAGQRLNHVMFTLALSEWTPLDSVTVKSAGSAEKRVKARKAFNDPRQQIVNTGFDNIGFG